MSSAGPSTCSVENAPLSHNPNLDVDERETILGLQRLQLQVAVPLLASGGEMTLVPMPKLAGNERKGPLTLVDLPVDVLKDIVKEVTLTNDLTNLCLTCRCLHGLAIPQIYSRFDIVWPDANTTGDRIGVDALTHGLATLTNTTKRGNDYVRWVKKFSLGYGPADWVGEYNINKECGKMLGTLVNLAISRMECLETFSWDMPTGILRDVFMSLHDLGTLKKIHVRFHDNRDTTLPTSQDPSRRVESPTFKGFKVLRNLSVLDIDEIQYLQEMSHAVEQSVNTLKELRVGIAPHMNVLQRLIRDWDVLENTIAIGGGQEGVVGGVLGILFGRIISLEDVMPRRRNNRTEDANPASTPVTAAPVSLNSGNLDIALDGAPVANPAPAQPSIANVQLSETTAVAINENAAMQDLPPTASVESDTLAKSTAITLSTPGTVSAVSSVYGSEPKRLKLETLALERVPISVSILVNSKAIDWSCLSNLTILNCYNHERLWKALRRKFSPSLASDVLHSAHKQGAHTPLITPRARSVSMLGSQEYTLRLKKLHTDLVTPHLIAFIKDTLPPNSLEVLFLQETATARTVTMDSIYKGAIRRHRGSLRKLLVNSKNDEEADGHGFFRWTFKKEHLAFVSSGKMPKLRELGVALEYKDWHYFLTRLPHMQQLRSLYITHIRDAPHLTNFVPRELANQILSTVILRPEIELCYVGILSKCFEILEGPNDDGDLPDTENQATSGGENPAAEEDSEDDDESDTGDLDDDEDDLDEDGGDDSESDDGYADEENGKTGIRLREILFYDDKVEIFRARNPILLGTT